MQCLVVCHFKANPVNFDIFHHGVIYMTILLPAPISMA